MPTVPGATARDLPTASGQQPSPTELMMAAATMHQMGRLFEPTLADGDETKAMMNLPIAKKDSGPYNKWDEALSQDGVVRLEAGKGEHDPRKWFDDPKLKKALEDMDADKFDLPDNSVVLRKRRKDLTS